MTFFIKRVIIGILLTFVLFPAILLSQSVYIPLDYWAYDFIERLEAKGAITGILNGTKPYSREEMVGYLLQLEEKIKSGLHLNSVEQKQLDFLRFEFKEEFEHLTGTNGISYKTNIEKIKQNKLVGRFIPGFVFKNNRNLINFNKDAFQLFIDPIFYQDWLNANPDSLSHKERVFERTHGVTLWGSLGSHVGFYFNARDTKQWGTRTYPGRFDITFEGLGFVNGYSTHIWHDETVAYMVFKLPYFQIILGKDANYWGSGFNGSLSLSNNATSYDQVKLQTKFWRVKFTWLWGFLRTYPVVRYEDGGAKEKNIIAHRLEVDVTKWLDIGIYETVIFSNRRFELAYVNPINFYRSAEHSLGDDDNVSMGLDVELLLIPNVKLYGELLIDDLFTSRLGTGWFGNKTAFLTGGLWVDAFKIPNFDIRLEYARTRPFVYTHKTSINTFSHFSTGLGHWMGPNADDIYLRAQYRFSKSFVCAISFESFRHGANEPGRNVGGDFNLDNFSESEQYFDFLEGIRERRNRFSLELNYELIRNLYLGLNFKSASSKNMLLPGGQRGPVSRNEIALNISFNR